MVWARAGRRALAGWAAIGLCVGVGYSSSAEAGSMVVRVSGPSAKTYPPGSKLADGDSLVLKAGDVVTLLDAKGTRTLRGPGRFGVAPAASADPSGNVVLSALLDTKRVRRARTGAVRGNVGEAPAAPRRPNLWLADIAQSGTFCVNDPAALRLWRADAAKPASVRITGGGAHADATFAAGEAIAAWPATLAVKDGAAYRIDPGAQATDIRFALVGPVGEGLEAVASSLIAHACKGQIDLLADTATLADARRGN